MSTKKQLEEISAALKKASAMHAGQSKKLAQIAGKMKDDAKLEQKRRYTKSRRNTNKLVRVKTGENVVDKIKNVFTNKGDKGVTTNDVKEMATNTTIGATGEKPDYSYITRPVEQSRKVLTQVSTGGEAGVSQMGNFPTAPSFVPPMPPQGTLPMPPQPGMMNQQLPPVPQEGKKMPTGKEGKGIRSLPANVQEQMGYDPLSQKRNK